MLNFFSVQLSLLLCFFTALHGHYWAFEQSVLIDGVLRHAERRITNQYNGKTETKVEKSIVLVTDKPLVLTHSIMLEKQPLVAAEISYPHIGVYLPAEFLPLIGKRVQCRGIFQKTFDFSGDEIVFHIETVLDSEQLSCQFQTFFYEPEEVELCGMLYEEVYPGPPEYMSVEMGDRPEEAVFLTLKEPINVDVKKNTEVEEDDINEPEKGVRELQVVFSDSMPSKHQMKKEIVLKGTLYHAHTAHHHRRVLMMVNSWKLMNTKCTE